MFRFNQTTSYVPLKPLRETNGVHGSLYDILSDSYREVGPVSTVKRKTLWNVAANAAWQLVSFMVWDRTQKKLQTIPCFNPLLLFCLPPLPLTSAPILFLYLIFHLHQKTDVYFGSVSILAALISLTAKLPFLLRLLLFAPLILSNFYSFFLYSNSPAAERGAWGGTRFLDYLWCALRTC